LYYISINVFSELTGYLHKHGHRITSEKQQFLTFGIRPPRNNLPIQAHPNKGTPLKQV